MITEVDIQRLRGIKSGHLSELTGLVVFVGPNGSGKSTVLDAIKIGADRIPSEAIIECVNRRQAIPRGARWLFYRAQADSALISLVVGPVKRTVRLTRLSDNSSEFRFSWTAITQHSGSESHVGPVELGQSQGGGWSWTNAEAPVPGIPETRFLEYDRAGPLRLDELFTSVVHRGLRESFLSLVRELLPKVQNVEILVEGKEPVLNLVYRDGAIPVTLSGDGVQWLIRLSCDLAVRDGGVVLVEEPETHMHPGALRLAAGVFRAAVKRGVQVVLSTHSLELIDALVDGASEDDLAGLSLYRVQLDDGKLKSSRLVGADVAAARFEVASDLR